MGANRAFFTAAVVGLSTLFLPPSVALGQTEAPSGVAGVADPAEIPTEDTLETSFGLAMGSGACAGATGTSALAYNASNMAAGSTYHVEAFSQIIPGSRSNGGTYWTIGSSIVDSFTAKKFAVGTSFRGVFTGDGRQYSGWDWRTSVGVQAIPQLGLGLGFRWGRLRSNTGVEFPGGPIVRTGPTFDGITLDASLTLTPVPFLKIAGLGYNLIKTYSALAPQMAGGSVAITPVEELTIGGDVLVDLSTFESSEIIGGVGVSYIAGEMIPLRLGYRRDTGRNLNQITTGLGFNKGKFAVEGSLRQDLGGRRETYLLFMFRYAVY